MSDSHRSATNDERFFNETSLSLRELESVPEPGEQEVPVFDETAPEETRYVAYVNLNEFLAREQEAFQSAQEILIRRPTMHQRSFFSVPDHNGPSIIELPTPHQEESLSPPAPVPMPRMRSMPVQARRRVPRHAQGKSSNKQADMAKMLAEFKKLENYQLPLLMAEFAEEPTPNPDKAQFARDLMMSTFSTLTVSKQKQDKEEG